MDLSTGLEPVKLELQIAPLIDVVFLLLIYFMVSASLIKKEGDISFILPATVASTDVVTIPLEVLIEIGEDGTVVLEGLQFPQQDERLDDLVNQVRGLKAVAKSQQSPFFVNILPHRNALHERVINVMDACAAAQVESLTFSKAL
ncbi:MAG: biopolymer transporter ExbD [Kiritimatiellales bacterium]|nr:biopolymer transporter ExbD [Pontiella sp.]NNJ71428.1 biopolymer transporter ExbD [Kiritimatiellales bacterium]